MKFELGTVLEEGDRLEVPERSFVKINRGGTCEWLASPDYQEKAEEGCTAKITSDYLVSAPGLAGEVVDRYQRLAEVLGWWDPERGRKPMRSRDSYKPRVPALDDIAKPLVVAGDRVLQVRWVDGKPPFRLVAIAPNGRKAEGVVTEGGRSGTVNVTVEDEVAIRLELAAADEVVSYTLYGVSRFDAASGNAGIDDYDRASRIVAAISDSGGDWAFEGVQQISTLKLEPRVKKALTDAIEFGDWP
ncbi:hypothetical protein HFN63_00115 [Rhizobium leguminosarum]|uniref:hypothetical protein n=1 Tax=Rhizobium leguminosarum TaxID=384 RepID=UPI001C969DD3|nr:hypothetical protein [Rhizobium leguminosarum]MBY5768537.1 hypothetical protein [Rhizobium leguminosarum]